MKVRIRLSFRVLGLVLGTVFLVIFFAARIINNQFKESIVETMVKRDIASMEKIATSISNLSDREYQRLLTSKSIIESALDAPENTNIYKSLLKDICNNNSLLAQSWFSYDNDNNSRNVIKAEKTSFGIEVSTMEIDYGLDNPNDIFYKVKDNGDELLSDPDFFLFDKSVSNRYLKATIAVPVTHDGNFSGVAGIDLNLHELCRIIDTLSQDKNVTLLAGNGQIINFSDPDLIGQQFSNIDSTLCNAISQGNGNTIKDVAGLDSIYFSTLTVTPANLNSSWKLVTFTTADEIKAQIDESLTFVTRVIIAGLFFLAIIIFILSMKIVTPIKKVNAIINKLSLGQVDDALKMDIESNDELGQMADSSNKVVKGLLEVTKFAENIGNGHSDYNFSPLSDKDVLGNAIIEMKNSLDKAKVEENQRREEEGQLNWSSNGINIFNKVLRVDNNNMNVLAEEIIKQLTLYLDAQMGAFYIVPNDREGLDLIASIGFSKEKNIDNSYVAPGDGLVGRAYLEKETIFISEIPDNMDRIGSGLGQALPKSAMIVPLIYNKKLAGIIELYSFKVFQQYQIAFVEKLSENIASTISTVKNNSQTALLLEKSKKQAEVLEQQETEIRQNMQEMQAAQEESTQKEEQLTSIIAAFSSVMPIIYYDTNRRVIDANDDFLNLVKTKKEKLIGKRHKSEHFLNEKDQAAHDKFWEELLKGEIMESEEMFNDGKKEIWLLERFIPIMDSNTITEIMAIGIDITEQKKIEKRIQMVQEGIMPDDLKENIGKQQDFEIKQRMIDLTHLNVVYKNDEKKINTILKRYHEQIPEQLNDIELSIKNRNYKVLKMDTKALKTKINYLGIKSIYEMLDAILKLITEDQDLTSIPQIFETIKMKWEIAQAELSEILDKEA